MKIILTKRNLFYGHLTVEERKKAVSARYRDIEELKQLQKDFDILSPEEFLKLFLKFYDIQLFNADFISLGETVTLETDVVISESETEVFSVDHHKGEDRTINYRAKIVGSSSMTLKNPISVPELKSLIAEKKILLLSFKPRTYLQVKNVEYDGRKEFSPLNNWPLDFDKYQEYALSLVKLIKESFNKDELAKAILDYIEDARREIETLKGIINAQIIDYHVQVQALAIRRDQEIADLDKFTKISEDLARELQKKS